MLTVGTGDAFDQGRLAALAGAGDEHDPGMRQALDDERASLAIEDVSHVLHCRRPCEGAEHTLRKCGVQSCVSAESESLISHAVAPEKPTTRSAGPRAID